MVSEDILKETMKKLTWCFPLYPVSVYAQYHQKQQKDGELVTSLPLRKIPFLVRPFESGNCEKKRKKLGKKIQYPKNKKSFLEEREIIFHNFLNVFFW